MVSRKLEKVIGSLTQGCRPFKLEMEYWHNQRTGNRGFVDMFADMDSNPRSRIYRSLRLIDNTTDLGAITKEGLVIVGLKKALSKNWLLCSQRQPFRSKKRDPNWSQSCRQTIKAENMILLKIIELKQGLLPLHRVSPAKCTFNSSVLKVEDSSSFQR